MRRPARPLGPGAPASLDDDGGAETERPREKMHGSGEYLRVWSGPSSGDQTQHRTPGTVGEDARGPRDCIRIILTYGSQLHRATVSTSRKLRRSSWPTGVRIDSGWNCT